MGHDYEIRDQGFTRPKVLILAPFKKNAFDIINTLTELSGLEIEHKKRFIDEFDLADDTVDPSKPKDYQLTFAGNVDDCFRIGLKFTRKHLKLYSEFYASDIIVASPLGLRMIIGAQG